MPYRRDGVRHPTTTPCADVLRLEALGTARRSRLNGSIRTLWPVTVPLSPPDDTPVAARPLVNLSLRWATLALREFVRLNPGNAAVLPARQLLGQVLVERGDLSAAVTEFERILVDAPNNPTALRYLRALRGRVPG